MRIVALQAHRRRGQRLSLRSEKKPSQLLRRLRYPEHLDLVRTGLTYSLLIVV